MKSEKECLCPSRPVRAEYLSRERSFWSSIVDLRTYRFFWQLILRAARCHRNKRLYILREQVNVNNIHGNDKNHSLAVNRSVV
jgi:hypothetical protein